MNDELPGPYEPPTAPVPPVPPAPPTEQGPIDWTPRDPSAGAVPPPPPPPQPQWAPPSDPYATAVQPTVPQPTTQQPPVGPPTGPPMAPPMPPPGAWNQQPAAAPTAPPPPTSKKTGLIIGVLVVIALIIGGIAAAVVVLGDSDPELTLDIVVCEIAADGTMTASGSVENTSGSTAEVDVDVVFRDDATSSTVDADALELTVPGDSGERWSLTGSAGDEVQRISCDVTVDS